MRWAVAVAVIGVALVGACGENQTLVAARHSAYNADRGVVIATIVAYLDERYETPRAVEDSNARPEVDPVAGTISTPWHLVRSNEQRSRKGPEPLQLVTGSYVRFDIAVVDGPPWRVHVVGHAGQMIEGARLMSDAPDDVDWLVLETNGVVADIYRRLEPYAVPVEK